MKKQILDTARVDDREGLVYSIGSFGGRVNFYAQQSRALNLAWALDGEELKEGDSVAVIGGGVTGFTIAAGLISLGYRVDIFEKGIASINRQIETQHRMAHPTINHWPLVAPNLTTELPFLEWHFGQCDTVASGILAQFEELRAKFEAGKPAKSQVLLGVTAEKILQIAAKLVVVKSNAKSEDQYRLAVIAVGFGKERDPAPFDTREYWESDDLEQDRNKEKYKYYIVSGAGDGGLIDVLRIVHPDFRRGRLAFEVAAELFDTEIAEIIKAGETEASRASEHDAAQLERVYRAAAERLASDPRFEPTHQKLWTSLQKFGRLVYLTDVKWSAPFSRSAAPIHKLMVAHAKRMYQVEYASGAIIDEGDDYSIGGIGLPKSQTKVIIRHGADPEVDLKLLLSKNQIKHLRDKQKHLADLAVAHSWAPFPQPAGAPPHDPVDEDFIAARKDLAEDAMRLIHPRSEVYPVEGGFAVTFRDSVPTLARGRLFGIQTEYRVASHSTGLAG